MMPSGADRGGALSPDRQALLDLWLSQDEAGSAASPPPFAPPRGEQEGALAEIWREVLHAERVGIDDNYFSLGGDSILAIVVVTRAQDAGVPISTHDLFETPTIRQLAARLPAAPQPPPAAPAPGPAAPGPGVPGPAVLPLTPLQAGMLYHAQADPSAYIVQVTCRLEGDVDAAELARAWQVIVGRHPELRASFRVGAAGPGQVAAARATVPVEIADWRQPDALSRPLAARLRQYLADDRARGFDLGAAPLLRVALLRLADSAYQCVLTHHHLLLDGWSQQLVLAELLDVYDQIGAGEIRPAPSRLPFGAYLDWLARQDLPAAEAFWREELRGLPPPPPAGGRVSTAAGGRVSTAAGGRVSTAAGGPASPGPDSYAIAQAVLPPGASADLSAACRRLGVTLGTAVLGGWALLLGHLHQAADVTFGVTVSGRPPGLPGVEQALGMFINTLPARIRIRPEAAAADWLRSVRRAQAGISRYQYSPLTAAERCAGIPAGTRLFDSIVVVENFPTVIREDHATGRLRITGATADVTEGYPLVLDVRPGDVIRLRLRYDGGLVSAETATAAAAAMREYLSGAAAGLPARVADLAAAMAAAMARHRGAYREQARAAGAARLRAARRVPAEDT